jgi:hypothetical protein
MRFDGLKDRALLLERHVDRHDRSHDPLANRDLP